jgi:hypothetical protein
VPRHVDDRRGAAALALVHCRLDLTLDVTRR